MTRDEGRPQSCLYSQTPTGPPLRVLMVTTAFPLTDTTLSGGTASSAYYLCRAMARRGDVEIHVIRPGSDPVDLDTREVGGIAVTPLRYDKRFSQLLGLLVLPAFQLRPLANAIKPDIVHVQNAACLAKLTRSPVVFTLHGIPEIDVFYKGRTLGSWIKSIILRATEGEARFRIRNVIAISPYTRSVLRRMPSKHRIWDIPNPIGEDYFFIERTPMPNRILSASHAYPAKNLRALIVGFAELAKRVPSATLRLAGSSQNSEYGLACRQLASELNVGDKVHFLGLLSVAEMQNELRMSACSALCSLQENAPMSIAEALAVGVPCVASKIGGIPSMIQDGVNGRLVQHPTNPHEIAQALYRVLVEDDAHCMSMAAKRSAQAYHPDTVAAQTVAVYRDILSAS